MKLGTLGQREKFLLGVLALMALVAAWRYLKPVLLSGQVSRWLLISRSA